MCYDSEGAKNPANRAFMICGTGAVVFGNAYILAMGKGRYHSNFVHCLYSARTILQEIVFCSLDESEILREYHFQHAD